MAELLNIEGSKIYNIVCIPSNAILKIKHDGELVRYNTIVDKITSYDDKKIDNVNQLYKKLVESNIKSKKIKKEHINNIKTKNI